jgi:DNA-binding MarR family transcriptional regulator
VRVDVDLETATLASRLRLATVRLSRLLRGDTTSQLTPSQMSALATVDEHGPLRVSDVAARENIQAPVATRVLASLEDLSLLTRLSDPDDRRASLVQLSNAGRTMLNEIRIEKTRVLSDRLATLSRRDLDTLARALPVLETLVEPAT